MLHEAEQCLGGIAQHGASDNMLCQVLSWCLESLEALFDLDSVQYYMTSPKSLFKIFDEA